MKWAEIHKLPCSIARALSVVGDRWTALIVRDALIGIRRFDEFQSSLGMSRHRLSDRLGRLLEEGVLEKRLYQESPARYEYKLTEKGRDLYPVMLMLGEWGDKWMAGDEGPPSHLKHLACGHITHPEVVCSECREPISPLEMAQLPGPSVAGQAVQSPDGKALKVKKSRTPTLKASKVAPNRSSKR